MKTNKDLERKRKNLIPEIIRTYANIPLKGKPENLHEIYKKFRSDSYILFGLKEEVIDYKINEIIELSNVNESNVDAYNERVQKLTKDLSQKSDIISKLMLKAAKELSYKIPTASGYYEIHYNPINSIVDDVYKYYFDVEPKPSCPCNFFRKNAIDNNLFIGPNRLKCYECDQSYFIYILDSIILNKSYEEIPGFNDLIMGYSETRNYRLCLKNNKILKERTDSYHKDNRLKFPTVFDGLLSTLLIELLSDPKFNRKRIIRCRECNDIYVADDSKKKRCDSDKCRKNYNKKKRSDQRAALKKKKHENTCPHHQETP